MADGEILRGNRWTALPLHGKNGTLLYATAVSMSCNITISWENGNDVDIMRVLHAQCKFVDGVRSLEFQ